MTFDRLAFEREKRELLLQQGSDSELFELGNSFIVESDRHGYAYQWEWCGLPIIQMPQDVLALQQILWRSKPNVVIETGVAWGGGLALYASVMDLYGGRLVVGIDLNLATSVEDAISSLPLRTPIRLIQASSTDSKTVETVRSLLTPDDRVMVVLDSDHTHAHVLDELNAYSDLVTPGQYLVVSDTIVERIPEQNHRPRNWGHGNNPATAVEKFLLGNADFAIDAALDNQLVMSFNPGGYLIRQL